MSTIVPRSGGGSGLERHGGHKADDTTRALSYRPTESGVGWALMPKSVRRHVEDEVPRLVGAVGGIRAGARATLSEPVASGSGDPVTRRRADGSTYQSRHGWWCGSGLLVEVEVRRDLAAREDGRYEPVGDWVEHAVTWHRLTDVTTKARRYEVGGEGTGGGEAQRTTDPLEAIPASAAAMVRVGLRSSDCWLTTAKRPKSAIGGFIVAETVVAYAIDGGRLGVLKAERTALTTGPDRPSAEALGSAAWRVTVTRAALSPVEPTGPALVRPASTPRLGRARRALGR
jgi:hypothetical protein